MMGISLVHYDWKETLTVEMLIDALAQFGLSAKEIENGDSYDFAIFPIGTSDEKIVEVYLREAGYSVEIDGQEEYARVFKQFLSYLKPLTTKET